MLEEILDTDKDSVKLRKTLKVLKYVLNRLNRGLSHMQGSLPGKLSNMTLQDLNMYIDTIKLVEQKSDIIKYMNYVSLLNENNMLIHDMHKCIVNINTYTLKISEISKLISSIKLLSKGEFLMKLREDDDLEIDTKLLDLYRVVNMVIRSRAYSTNMFGMITDELLIKGVTLRPIYDIYLFMEKIDKTYSWKISWSDIYSILDGTFNILENNDEFNTISKVIINSSEVKNAYTAYKVKAIPHRVISDSDEAIDIHTLHNVLRSNGKARSLLINNSIDVDNLITLLEICNMESKYDYIVGKLRICIYASMYMKLASDKLKKVFSFIKDIVNDALSNK